MKYVLITGANGGIGQELCRKFKENGWFVFGTDIKFDCNNDCIDIKITADLAKEEDCVNISKTIKEKTNKLDCIVNNAAMQICKEIYEMSISEWDLIYNCNVRGIFLLVKYLVDIMKHNSSNIINIGSVHGTATSDKIACYASSKAAIVGLTKNLAIELAKFDIRVNCVSPGAVNTPMLIDGLKRGHLVGCDENTLIKSLENKHLLKKIGMPCEIANLVFFLVSDNIGFMNGSNIIIDGGVTIKLSSE